VSGHLIDLGIAGLVLLFGILLWGANTYGPDEPVGPFWGPVLFALLVTSLLFITAGAAPAI
jgi:hypothetical protein